MNEGSLSLTHNLDRPILEISGFNFFYRLFLFFIRVDKIKFLHFT